MSSSPAHTRDSGPEASASLPDQIRTFAKSILHGDQAHKDWLLAAAEAFIAGKRVPTPPKPKPQPKPHRIRDLRHALD